MDWYDRIPKAELHIHLEGSIPSKTLWRLIEKYGGDPEVPTLEDLRQRFVYRDFPHFIDTWMWMVGFLREYEDFTLIAADLAHDLASQNIRYVEAFYSPSDFARYGLEPQGITQAISSGLSRVSAVQVALVADLIRDGGPEKAATTLAQVDEVRDQGVVGIGIGGSEQSFPPEPFKAVYADARRRGFRTSAHAGEAAGAPSVWGAIEALRVDRIGHGTRAEEDPHLVDALARRRIPVELCPLSNLRTGVVSALAEHPVRRYFDGGLLVSINTDDPKMLGNTLAEEYRLLAQHFDFTPDEIRTLILQAVETSWLDSDGKQKLAAALRSDPAWRQDAVP